MKLIIALLLFSLPALAADVREGVYALTGSNPHRPAEIYTGTVAIAKTAPNAYLLHWKIGENQAQEGTAFVEGDILKVSYRDLSGSDFGIVEYRLLDRDLLEGPWWSHHAPGVKGQETLSYSPELN